MTSTTELTGDYVVDPARTRVGFVARHTMATSVAGRFPTFEGHVRVSGEDVSHSSVHVTIEAAGIQTGNRRRDQALRDKFLDAPNHPVITFSSSSVNQVDESTVALTGDLTIRGTTRRVTIPFTLTGAEPDQLVFTGATTINRRDWGAHWSAVGFLVAKEVRLEFEVTTIRTPAG